MSAKQFVYRMQKACCSVFDLLEAFGFDLPYDARTKSQSIESTYVDVHTPTTCASAMPEPKDKRASSARSQAQRSPQSGDAQGSLKEGRGAAVGIARPNDDEKRKDP